MRLPTSPEATVRAVADSFFAAATAERWAAAVAWIDMAAFEKYFQQVAKTARSELPPPRLTVEDLMAQDSTMPRVVAEWELAHAYRASASDTAPRWSFSHDFARVRNPHDLLTLSVPEAAARWLEAKDVRYRFRDLYARSNCPAEVGKAMVAAATPHLVGVAVPNDSLGYVIYQARDQKVGVDPYSGANLSVMVLRRTPAGWRIVPLYTLLSGAGGAVAVMCERG